MPTCVAAGTTIACCGAVCAALLSLRIKHMQNGISSGCSALSVKCQVSNHKPVNRQRWRGLMDDTVWGAVFPEGLEACAHLHMSQTHLA